MAATTRARVSFLALAIAFIAIVATVNLIFNLESFPTFEPAEGEVEGTTLTLPSESDLGLTAIMALLVSLAAGGVFMVAYMWFRLRGLRFSLEELLPLIIIGLLVMSFVFLIVPAIQEQQDQLEEEFGTAEEGEEGTGGGLTEVVRERFLRLSPALVGVAVIFLAIVLSYVLRNSLRWKRWRALSELLSEEASDALQRTTAVIEKGLYRLELGEDVRSSILGCYRDLLILLQGRGLLAEDHLTARELELAAGKDLGLSTKSCRSLRRLFELARYSSHSLTEAHRQRALDSLRQARRELGG